MMISYYVRNRVTHQKSEERIVIELSNSKMIGKLSSSLSLIKNDR